MGTTLATKVVILEIDPSAAPSLSLQSHSPDNSGRPAEKFVLRSKWTFLKMWECASKDAGACEEPMGVVSDQFSESVKSATRTEI